MNQQLDCAPDLLLRQLDSWTESGALRQLDRALARFVHQHHPQADAALLLATALLGERNGHGHVCLDLRQALARPGDLLAPRYGEQSTASAALQSLLQGLDLRNWVTRLLASPVVVTDCRDNTDSPDRASPLVLAGTSEQPLLYLRRYWQYERDIRSGIHTRLTQHHELPVAATRDLLAALFAGSEQRPDWQRIACLLAARSGFSIITGGPGTGKTTTVVRLLALLQALQLSQQKPALRICLAAPTGKAAARLNESIAGNVHALSLPETLSATTADAIRQSIPTEVTTLHRLLGSRAQSRHFHHHAGNPVAADMVVVDEASMVDVEMLASLLAALSPHARLILLGDKDQLASVEAGSVLGDLCQRAAAGHYTAATCQWIEQLSADVIAADSGLHNTQGSALQQATAMLRHSYRFAAWPGIGRLAAAVNSGTASVAQLREIFTAHARQADHPPAGDTNHQANLKLIHLDNQGSEATAPSALLQLLRAGYAPYLRTLHELRPADTPSREQLDAWAKAVFAEHRQFQLLTALRQGPRGVAALNQLALQALHGEPALHDRLPAEAAAWYVGRPVLVTRNDYSLRLMNGDIGICLDWPAPAGSTRRLLRVAFPDGQGGIRWILPGRLQAVETVFAMTVHKSQGSEFRHTALVLPDTPAPVLTRELLYTGITRSSRQFTLLYSNESVLQTALDKRVERASGLRE